MKRFAVVAAFVLPTCVAAPEEVAPRILVDACAGGSETVGAFTGGVSECALTRQLAVAAPTNIVVTLLNQGNERLTLTRVELSPDSDPSYVLLESPAVIPAGETAEIVVVARTLAFTTTASLVIHSDAVNAEAITVEITGNAIDAGLPDLVAPAACDFGEVSLSGDVARCEVALSNVGVRDLILDRVVVADCEQGDCAFRLSAPVAEGTALPPGTSASITLLFRPDALGAYDAVLTIFTNDPDESPLEVILTAVVVP